MALAKIVFILMCVILLVTWILGTISQFLMIRNRKEGVKLFESKFLFNPFNMQFFGQKYLTEKGIYWRSKSWLFYGVFVIAIIILLSLNINNKTF